MTGENTARMSSVLGPSAVVLGNVKGSGDLEVRGRVQGSIALSGRVHIAECGVVLGDVEAVHISVAGEIRGNVLAQDGVLVASSGRVEGDIVAPRVGIEAGARVHGQLRTGGEFGERSELLQQRGESLQHAPQVPAFSLVSPKNAPLPLAATVPFKAPSPVPAIVQSKGSAQSAALAPQPSAPPPSLAATPAVPRGAPSSGEHASGRPRKRKRPRSPFAPPAGAIAPGTPTAAAASPSPSPGNAPAAQAAGPASPARAPRPRPQGPPVVPTFENGAKPRSRS